MHRNYQGPISIISIQAVNYEAAYSPVAQSVEQVAVNHWVASSSLAGGAGALLELREAPFYFPVIF